MREFFKENLLKKVINKIAQTLDGNTNTPSSVRLQSYFVLAPILLMVLMFIVLEFINLSNHLSTGTPYRISNEIIVVFGMVLSHHLALLFSRNKSQSIFDITGKKDEKLENTEEVVKKDIEKIEELGPENEDPK